MNIKKLEPLYSILYTVPKKEELKIQEKKDKKVEKIFNSNKNHFDKYA